MNKEQALKIVEEALNAANKILTLQQSALVFQAFTIVKNTIESEDVVKKVEEVKPIKTK